jgi:hypothetical protein
VAQGPLQKTSPQLRLRRKASPGSPAALDRTGLPLDRQPGRGGPRPGVRFALVVIQSDAHRQLQAPGLPGPGRSGPSGSRRVLVLFAPTHRRPDRFPGAPPSSELWVKLVAWAGTARPKSRGTRHKSVVTPKLTCPAGESRESLPCPTFQADLSPRPVGAFGPTPRRACRRGRAGGWEEEPFISPVTDHQGVC